MYAFAAAARSLGGHTGFRDSGNTLNLDPFSHERGLIQFFQSEVLTNDDLNVSGLFPTTEADVTSNAFIINESNHGVSH